MWATPGHPGCGTWVRSVPGAVHGYGQYRVRYMGTVSTGCGSERVKVPHRKRSYTAVFATPKQRQFLTLKILLSWMYHLFFRPEFIKHLLDFQLPILLHSVKWVLGCIHKRRHSDLFKYIQDITKCRPLMWLRVPTFWRISLKMF
jgi:hypothetical protein